MGTARAYGGAAGTQTAGLAFAGSTPSLTTATEEFTGEVVQLGYTTISDS